MLSSMKEISTRQARVLYVSMAQLATVGDHRELRYVARIYMLID
jgi:hypothetical protein